MTSHLETPTPTLKPCHNRCDATPAACSLPPRPLHPAAGSVPLTGTGGRAGDRDLGSQSCEPSGGAGQQAAGAGANTQAQVPSGGSKPTQWTLTREEVLDAMLADGALEMAANMVGQEAMKDARSLLLALCKSDATMSLLREWREDLRAEAYGKWVKESLKAAGYEVTAARRGPE